MLSLRQATYTVQRASWRKRPNATQAAAFVVLSSRSFASQPTRSWSLWFKQTFGSLSIDHGDPKRLLERRYLYFGLMALKLRELRADNPNDLSLSELRAKSVDYLSEKEQVDNQTNVDLREMHNNALQPQLQLIFQAFQQADDDIFDSEKAQLEQQRQQQQQQQQQSYPHKANGEERRRPPPTPKPFDSSVDVVYLKELLNEEFNHTQNELLRIQHDEQSEREKSAADPEALQLLKSRAAFLNTKQNAVATLLDYHGISATTGTRTTTMENSKDSTATSPSEQPQESSNSVDFFGMEHSFLQNDERLEFIRQYQTLNICRSALIRNELGYSILCLKSTLPQAGRGVFVDGHAHVGDLVALQPGEVWAKEFLADPSPEMIDHFAAGDEECLTSLRFDDYVVDSRNSPVTVLTQQGSMNPFALGHMANHPNTGQWPNCQSLMLNYCESAFKAAPGLERYLPNTYARARTWRSQIFDQLGDTVLMHGLCLMARRDICNEELLYDYRLQTDDPPEWYNPVMYGDELMDEQQVVFFGAEMKNVDNEDDDGVKQEAGTPTQPKWSREEEKDEKGTK